MSATPEPPAKPEGPAAEPSMEDILASIRRILNEDEATQAPASPLPSPLPSASRPRPEDVLVLDGSMMVAGPEKPGEGEPDAGAAAPAAAPVARLPAEPSGVESPAPEGEAGRLIAPEAAAAAAAAVDGLVRRLVNERSTLVHHAGPTIEDLVREEVRPLLKAWLDANLPPLVERLVRSEIERVLGRIAP